MRAPNFKAPLIALMFACAPVAMASELADPDTQSFKVHGDWVVTVLNNDGSVAARHEFANALMDDGKATLVELLGGLAELTPDSSGEPIWALAVGTAGIITDPACTDVANAPAEENSPARAALTATSDAGSGTYSLVLTRTLTLPASCLRAGLTFWEVTEVGSRVSRTPAGGSPVSALFALKTMSPAIQVQPDQSVFLEATYTFN